MAKEDYESNGNRYSVLANQYTMRFDEIPVVRLRPETFVPNGKRGWGGTRLGKSVKRVTHYFAVGSETSLCGKPHIHTHGQKTMENRAGRTTVFGDYDFAWPIEVHSVMSAHATVCKSCLKALAKADGNDDAIQAWMDACNGVSA